MGTGWTSWPGEDSEIAGYVRQLEEAKDTADLPEKWQAIARELSGTCGGGTTVRDGTDRFAASGGDVAVGQAGRGRPGALTGRFSGCVVVATDR